MKRSAVLVLLLTFAALVVATLWVPTQFPPTGQPSFFNADFAWPIENWRYATMTTTMDGHLSMDSTSAYWRSWGNPNRPDLGVLVPAQPYWPLWVGQVVVIGTIGWLLVMFFRTRERQPTATT